MSDILELANSIKKSTEEIRKAIINKGVAVDSLVKLADYPAKISAIRKASDYTISAIDAINYTGKEIAAGDKVWLVPQNVSEDGEALTLTGYSNYAIVSRDGTAIYLTDQKYDIASGTYTPLNSVSTSSKEMLRWGSKDIYVMTSNSSTSCISSRGSSVYCYLYDDLCCSQNEVFYKGEKIGDIADICNAYAACYDRANKWLYIYHYSYNSENYITRYKIDTSAKSVSEDSSFHIGVGTDSNRGLMGTTGDGKYLIVGYAGSYRMERLWIAKINDNGLQFITDLSDLCADLAGICDNPNVRIQFNGVDDILLLRYNGFQWVFKYSADKFELISKIEDLGFYQYEGEMSCSADGKVICGANSFKALKNNSSVFKAINFTGNVSADGYSGIAETAAGSGKTFKAGVVLPPVG